MDVAIIETLTKFTVYIEKKCLLIDNMFSLIYLAQLYYDQIDQLKATVHDKLKNFDFERLLRIQKFK